MAGHGQYLAAEFWNYGGEGRVSWGAGRTVDMLMTLNNMQRGLRRFNLWEANFSVTDFGQIIFLIIFYDRNQEHVVLGCQKFLPYAREDIAVEHG